MVFVFGDSIVICRGRLKGEKGTVIGESNLNMEHRIIVHRKKGRNRVMGFARWELRKAQKGGE